jgi:hypothetical protein
MDLALWLKPSAAGLTLAVAAVVGGAPLFSAGLRSLRLRRQLRGARRRKLDAVPDGRFAMVSGRVALESPLFAPLSGTACAGYDLEFRAVGSTVRCVVSERRPFRLVTAAGSAHVAGSARHWQVGATVEREIAADGGISEGLATLLARAPEALWWRRAGGRLRVIERALAADAECHVVGMAQVTRAAAASAATAWVRTGTDGAIAIESPPAAAAPDVTIGSGDGLDWLLVSDRQPDPRQLSIPLARAAGTVLGPLVSLLGMLYLASAADHWRALGRF